MGLLSGNGTPGRVLVGSATHLDRSNSSDLRRVTQDWQGRSLNYYDLVPEVWFASQFYSRGLSKLRLFPAMRTEEDEIEPSEDQTLKELWDRVQDPHGGRKQMFSSYGRLRFLTGESYLLCTAPDGLERWEVVSTKELRIEEDTVSRFPSDGGRPLTYTTRPTSDESIGPEEAIVYRMWRSHPRKSMLADAPMRASLDICEELVLLTLGIRARIRSRLSGAGILAIDSEVTLPASDVDEESDEDAFIRNLGEHLMEPIGDEGSASAVVPYLVRIPTNGRPVKDLIEHIRVHNPGEEFPERGMREEAVKRLATGLDLPPELLLGLADANHWTSWQIDEQSWELLQPTVQELCDDFAGAYLRPAAREALVADWDRVTLGYDETEIVTRPDRSKDAAQAHDRLVISDASYRAAAGWNDDDAPDEEELMRRIAVKVRMPNLIPGVEGNTEQKQPPQQPPSEPPAPTQPTGKEGGQASMIVGAAEYAVERARELAGSRIRTRTKSCGPCQQAIDGLPNSLVASVLGPEATAQAGDEHQLVAGAGGPLARSLMRQGVSEPLAINVAMQVEEHAALNLHLPNPPPLAIELEEA